MHVGLRLPSATVREVAAMVGVVGAGVFGPNPRARRKPFAPRPRLVSGGMEVRRNDMELRGLVF